MDTIRLIEAFLENTLEGQELETFLKRMETDPAFKFEVELHREINESILDDSAGLRKQISGLLPKQSVPKVNVIRIIVAAAAVLIISLVLFPLRKQLNPADIYTSFYAPYQTDLNTRSSNIYHDDVSYAYYLYQNKEYKTAYELLKNNVKAGKLNYIATFYLGLCAIELNHYAEAEECMKNVCAEGDSVYCLHANWYLSLIYLKTNQPGLAKSSLEKLTQSQNYYTKRAEQILKKNF